MNYNQLSTNFQHFHVLSLTNKQNIFWKGMWITTVWEI